MSDFEALRRLLVGPEQERLDAQASAVSALEQAQAALPERLPELVEQATAGPARPRLEQALAPVVGSALGDAVRRDRRAIVDALFPIIGPAIRRAVAESLRSFVADLNRALEWSVSPRAWRWRLEAWRSGAPFAQVVLKHTLSWRLDHVFLIERESGLLLYRQSAPELAELDADAIAGMLTAIGDFVRDSVGSGEDGQGGLASATVGEHLVQVHEGPLANLACFVRGTPPSELAEQLRAALEALHAAHARDPELDWGLAAEPLLGQLAGQGAAAPVSAPPRWPARLLGLAALVLLAGLVHAAWQRGQTEARLRELVAATPGWQWLSIEAGQPWRLRLLRDPDSDPPTGLAARVGLPDTALVIEERAFLSLDDRPQERRLQRALAPPPGVDLAVAGGRVLLSGQTTADWHAGALARLRDWPGVLAVDDSALELGPDPALWSEYTALRAASGRFVAEFARGRAELAPAAVGGLAGQLVRALELARMLDRDLSFRIVGWTDEGGSEARNEVLRAARAEAVRAALIAAGVPGDRLAARAGEGPPQRRAVAIEWLEEVLP